MDAVELVKQFLRAQNLEQVGRDDEALELYETIVQEGFDSTGPYERLITLYSHRGLHRDVMRVADLALGNVQTHAEKRAWYERMRAEAERASTRVPRASKRKR